MMNSEQNKSESAWMNLSIQDVRRSRKDGGEVNKLDYRRRSFSQGHHGKRMFRSYFTLESLFLLVCLTVSLLVLPVVLPPLPPPPLLLLLLPILILALLMLLAFMPSAELTHA